MTIEIRLARAFDVDALAGIEEAVFKTDRISRASFRRLVRSASALVLVAIAQGDLAGYCAVLFRAGSDKARLYSIASKPGAGAGGRLLAAAEQEASARSRTELRLEVREDNGRAVSLYEKHGYRLFGRKPGYYADGVSALLYRKTLGLSEASAPYAVHALPGTLG